MASGRYLFFKHSQRCSTSSHAFREYRMFVEANPEVAHGWIDVVAQRDWARQIADETGVTHQSPQALLFVDGKVVWHASHFEITQKSLTEQVLHAQP